LLFKSSIESVDNLISSFVKMESAGGSNHPISSSGEDALTASLEVEVNPVSADRAISQSESSSEAAYSEVEFLSAADDLDFGNQC
jgi:hypothetical protein